MNADVEMAEHPVDRVCCPDCGGSLSWSYSDYTNWTGSAWCRIGRLASRLAGSPMCSSEERWALREDPSGRRPDGSNLRPPLVTIRVHRGVSRGPVSP